MSTDASSTAIPSGGTLGAYQCNYPSGWVCPKCGNVYAPFVAMCGACAALTTINPWPPYYPPYPVYPPYSPFWSSGTFVVSNNTELPARSDAGGIQL